MALRRLVEIYQFENKLEEELRDRFACGLNNAITQKQCLTIENLMLTRAAELVSGLEAAEKEKTFSRMHVLSLTRKSNN